MALTRITKGVIKPNENYDTHNINSTGIVTAIGLDVNGNGDISGNLSVGGILTYEDVTSIDSVGIITAQKDIHVGAGISAVGVGTFGSLDIGGDIDVDGHTNLDNVSIAGVTTFASHAYFGNNVRASFATNNRLQILSNGTNSYFDYAGSLNVRGSSGSAAALSFLSNSNVRVNNNLEISKDLDVDGHTNLDNVNIAGVSTFTGQLNANSTINVIGESTFRDRIQLVDGTPEILLSVPSGGLDSRILNDGSGNLIVGHGINSDTPTERLRIESDGDVIWNGTGTVTPGYSNSTVGMGFEPRNGTIFLSRADNLVLSTNRNNDGRIINFSQGGNQKFNIGLKNSGADLAFNSGTSEGTERLRITSDGKIGIGSDAPHRPLSITTSDATVHLFNGNGGIYMGCLLYTSPSPRDLSTSRMPSSA